MTKPDEEILLYRAIPAPYSLVDPAVTEYKEEHCQGCPALETPVYIFFSDDKMEELVLTVGSPHMNRYKSRYEHYRCFSVHARIGISCNQRDRAEECVSKWLSKGGFDGHGIEKPTNNKEEE